MSTVELGLTLTKALDAPSLCTIRDGVVASLDADSVYAHGGLLVGDRVSAIYIGVSKHTFAPSAEAAEVERRLGSAHGTVHLTVTRPTTASGEFDVVVHKDHPEDKVGLSVSSNTTDATGLPWVETVTTDSRAAHSGLKLGDKITKVGGTEVHSHHDVTKLIKQSTGDLHFTLQRDQPPVLHRFDLPAEKAAALRALLDKHAVDLVVETGEGVPLGLTLGNSPAQPDQPGPQEEGLVYVKEVTPYSPAADAGLAAGDIIVSVKGEAVVAHDRARDLVRASGTTVRLSVRKHAVDLDAIGGAFSTGAAWPQLDESSRALWSSLGWDAKSWARGPSPPTEDLEWKQLGDGERAAAEGLGYSEATWNDMKKWSVALKEAAAEAKRLA